MPKVAGRNTFIVAYSGSDGASRSLAGDGNNLTISWAAEAPETTGFGNRQRTRLAGGIRDVTIDLSGYWNAAATATACGMDDTIENWFKYGGTDGCPMLVMAPGGSTAGSPVYTACVVLTSYNVDMAYDGIVSYTAAFALRAGSLTRSLGVV